MPGMIVAPQPVAVEEGAKVLAGGGNAFDAAVTCAFVQFVVDPHSCGVGGYVVMTVHCAGGSPEQSVLDAPALAGSKVEPKMWEKQVLEPNPEGWGYFLQGKVNEIGYQSICTPGVIRGLHTALSRWGTRSWAEVIAPAAELAEAGWQVGEHLAQRWKAKANFYEVASAFEKLHVTPEASKIYLKPDGTAYDAGEIIRNPDYARTLKRLASAGADDFHTGELAEQITADLAANESYVTAEDFANYQIRDERPTVTRFQDYEIVTNQPPHGGPTLAAILNILDGYDLKALGHNAPEYIYRVSMAMKAGFADRNRHLGDPHYVDLPIEWMNSMERAAEWRRVIDGNEAIDTSRVQPGSPDTTHVSVVDAWGNAVSLTHSLGSSSGVITPGLGFMYNNSMVNFHPFSGHPNSIAPGKGRTTGMTPTLVLREGNPVLVIGAPGATRIITSVLQVILNRLIFGMSVSEAVLAPRFDCQGDVIKCQARIPEFVCAEVRHRHQIVRLPQAHGGLALVHAIGIDEETGQLCGGADAGADGMSLLVP